MPVIASLHFSPTVCFFAILGLGDARFIVAEFLLDFDDDSRYGGLALAPMWDDIIWIPFVVRVNGRFGVPTHDQMTVIVD